MQSQIIQRIVHSPNDYKNIIENANFSELKEIFSEYKQRYTDEDTDSIVQFYHDEYDLRSKLLSCSQSVIDTLSKK
ncbi:hypothetical protein [Mannheimia granulomatis]|uniref:hypothetical protein n=1 Tax=Mannheimia granulomatis TaxID=85402 RepID=UPI000478B992|nr:hypothetical protein [Mannheimia granulomatis]QLB19917.1 hypothetical protein A6B41_10895 [Mannheimia granulomatis]